jgi:4-hydroxy-3-methylbut-2-en-1-yl diphosphate reductase
MVANRVDHAGGDSLGVPATRDAVRRTHKARPAVTTATVLTPLRSERAALRGAVSAPVIRSGRGPSRCIACTGPVLVAGVAGALSRQLRPGDLVVATDLRTDAGIARSLAAPLLFGAVRRLGLRVHLGPLLSVTRVALGRDRAAQAESGAGQTVALRAVSDTPDAGLLSPGIIWRGICALRALRAAAPAIDQWFAATGDRDVLLANRPAAIRALAEQAEVVLVADTTRSPDAARLAKIAENSGRPAYLVADPVSVDLRWLSGAKTIGIAVAANTTSDIGRQLADCLTGLGQTTVHEIG